MLDKPRHYLSPQGEKIIDFSDTSNNWQMTHPQPKIPKHFNANPGIWYVCDCLPSNSQTFRGGPNCFSSRSVLKALILARWVISVRECRVLNRFRIRRVGDGNWFDNYLPDTTRSSWWNGERGRVTTAFRQWMDALGGQGDLP